MTALCFIDTETTGVHPNRQVWEIAMIRREEGIEDRELSFFVDVDLSEADPFGLSVGRFYERHPHGQFLSSQSAPKRAVSRAQAAERVATWTHGAHLVGAVPNFDAETLAPLLRAHGMIPAWHYHLIDVEALAVGFLAGLAAAPIQIIETGRPQPVALPWNSDDLSRACGVEPASEEERHTALGDARWAMRLYDAIVDPA